jgi:hypothetical protein
MTRTRYERIERDGKVSNLRVYEIPDPLEAEESEAPQLSPEIANRKRA